MRDPIVEEIRRIREEHAAQFNYDLHAIVEDIKRSEAARDWPKVSFATPRKAEPVTEAQPQAEQPVVKTR